MKRPLAFLALCLPVYLFAQGFGSFSHDQPFFAKDTSASEPCAALAPASTNALAVYDIAAMGLNDGDIISEVTDSSGHYNIFSTGAARPYWTNNASLLNATNGWANFDGADDYLQTNFTATYPQPTTQIMVSRYDFQGGSQPFYDIFWAGGGDMGVNQSMYKEELFLTVHSGAVYANPSFPSNLDDTFVIWEIVWNGANSYIKTNGVTWYSGDFGNGARKGITLAADANKAFPSHIQIAYAAYYTNIQSAEWMTANYNWLSCRFGLPQ